MLVIERNNILSAEVLHRFRNNSIGELCRTDYLIKLLGKNVYLKACSRGPKKSDGRKYTMRNMRALASLYLHLQNTATQAKCKEMPTSSASIFEIKYFEQLETAVYNMCRKADGSTKLDLKVQVCYLLRTVSDILQAFYLQNRQKDKVGEVQEFKILLYYNWREIFSGAEYAAINKRQEILRKQKQLPQEADMMRVRDYALRELARLTATGMHIGSTKYIKLQSLTCCRLILFNARRGGEPACLTLAEWKDGKTGA